MGEIMCLHEARKTNRRKVIAYKVFRTNSVNLRSDFYSPTDHRCIENGKLLDRSEYNKRGYLTGAKYSVSETEIGFHAFKAEKDAEVWSVGHPDKIRKVELSGVIFEGIQHMGVEDFPAYTGTEMVIIAQEPAQDKTV